MITVAISFNATATVNSIPEPFRGHDDNSTISIMYDDINQVLSMSVLDIGRSTRAKASKTRPEVNSRIKAKINRNTALEGNRFLFKSFKDSKNKAILTNIRISLERLPDEVPMAVLNRKEQLAYWLNLYNIALIEQLIGIYPRKNLKRVFYDDQSLLDNKFLNVSGVKLSLNDIHHNIIFGKFSTSPIVIYGLFQGIIGGPNIRKSAYTGDAVIKQLQQNAGEFINSNRGTYRKSKNVLSVSSFYGRNRAFFPDFNNDLKKHLGNYIDNNYLQYLESSNRLKADIKNYSIADPTGGVGRRSSSASSNPAALMNAVVAGGPGSTTGGNTGYLMANLATGKALDMNRFSPATLKLLHKLKEKNNESRGKVILTEQEQ